MYDLFHEQLPTVVDEIVGEVLTRYGISRPPVDALAVARTMQLVVAVDDRQSGRARTVRLRHAGSGTSGSILLRSEPRYERRQWAIAHEIGEHLAAEVFVRLGADPSEEPTSREYVANYFASRLLLPTEWLAADGAELDWDLFELKQRYETASHELLARRMLDFPEPLIVTIFDQGKIYLRRSNAGRPPRPSSQELACWRAAHTTGRPTQRHADTLRTRAWAIHEAHWKREILRTEE